MRWLAACATAAFLVTTSAAFAVPAHGDRYAEVTVTIKDNRFSPAKLEIEPGTTVKWTNEGRNDHNVVASIGNAFGNALIKPKETYEFRFEAPGTYRYYCSFHGTAAKGQRGSIVVKGAGAPGGAKTPVAAGGGKPRTIHVPKDAATIQAGVDVAKPGDLVLVAPGVYKEAVTVTTKRIVIRGVDRKRTILDGEFTRENGVKVVGADGVAIENLTARNFQKNGFFWTDVSGYRGSYLTAYRNGDYGIYAFNSVRGLLDQSYAAGSPDAGFYIGQCNPCDAVIEQVTSEWNGLGFSGTNAGGNLVIVDSTWRRNRVGIVPNSLDSEANPPQHEATIAGNTVYSNNNAQTPAIDAAVLAMGNGILVAGGNDNVVEHNLVFDHDIAGIAVVPSPDQHVWIGSRNRVERNVVRDSRYVDLGFLSGDGNCFAANSFKTSAPADIERVAPCKGTQQAAADQIDAAKYLTTKPPGLDYRSAPTPEPPSQPGMPHAKTAKAKPATDVPPHVDVGRITTPKPPAPA
jgi:plastocyanin